MRSSSSVWNDLFVVFWSLSCLLALPPIYLMCMLRMKLAVHMLSVAVFFSFSALHKLMWIDCVIALFTVVQCAISLVCGHYALSIGCCGLPAAVQWSVALAGISPLFWRSAIPKVLYGRRASVASSGGGFWGKAPGLGFRVSFCFGLELGY